MSDNDYRWDPMEAAPSRRNVVDPAIFKGWLEESRQDIDAIDRYNDGQKALRNQPGLNSRSGMHHHFPSSSGYRHQGGPYPGRGGYGASNGGYPGAYSGGGVMSNIASTLLGNA